MDKLMTLLKCYGPAVALTLFMLGMSSYILMMGDVSDIAPVRWYSDTQQQAGKLVFDTHCARCHGTQAQGLVANWQGRLADGSYPPPPLNGTAHAWHHELPLLLQIVQQGGAPYDGKMPGFGKVLNMREQLAVIAYFQSFWTDEVYQRWQTGNDDLNIPFSTTASRSRMQNQGAVHATGG